MTNVRLTNLLSYKNYCANLAAQHVAITTFRWGNDVVIKNDNRSALDTPILWAMPYEDAQFKDVFSDNNHRRKVARVSYLEARNSEKFTDVDAQFEACEAVMDEIIARIIRDKVGYEQTGDWVIIATDINSFKTSPVEMKIGSTPYIGYELEMTFSDPANFTFNTQRWADTLI